ncbi:Pyrrolo-quinoline quinone repeat [uncultured Caudovirales phage]|uniref:Pyrrolo-quinoline quinone repeat n=1 Tax=uncultured Caudovirales phage TaxID=2100421 RepID=A0A6J5L4C0_9CAUD|nr:Pyrrolo-quinoline quinone repeat [uncultured Caudovirales phage]
MTARIKIRRDSAASWTDINPILAAGELGLDTDANQIKVGDGTTAWADLAFASGGAGFDGTSDLVFQTEDLGFYAFSLNQYATWSQVEAVAMDSSASNSIADNIYAVGTYYDDDNGWQSSFVTKRNNDDTEAWTVSFRNQADNENVELNTIIWDGVQDKLYVGGEMYTDHWRAVVLELDTTNGAILSQAQYEMPQGNYPVLGDMLVDQSDGSVILTGSFAEQPRRVHITPVGNTGNPQGDSSDGQIADGNLSLLVVAKTDFTSVSANIPDPNPNEYWAWFDQTNPTDGGSNFNEINQFRDLPTVTVTGTGSGARVRINYSIADNKWLYAQHSTWEGGAVYEYKVGDTIKILGSSFGGVDETDDVVLTVNYVYNWSNYHDIGFVRLDKQTGIATPPSVVTDYVRFWQYGFYSFASQIGQGTVWDIARRENRNGFVLTNNFQIAFGDAGWNDVVKSADNYSDVNGSFIYVGVYRDTSDEKYNGKRAVVYKIDAATGDQVWSKTVDMITDGTMWGDFISSVNCDASGNVYVVANGSNTYENTVMIVTKLDANGTILWQVQQDEGLGSWYDQPKGDIDLNDGSFYIAGNRDGDVTFMKLDPANGSVLWSRVVNFMSENYSINAHYDNELGQHIGVGRGRIAFGGYSYDGMGLYNSNNRFGILMGLDADQINALDDNEVGSFGPFTLEVDNFHTVPTSGSGNSYAASSTQHTTADISEVASTNITNPNNNITLTPVDITRSPFKIENVQSIRFADGSVQTTAGSGVKATWKNPNNNIWKIVEWNGGRAVDYDQYDNSLSAYFNAANTNLTGVDSVSLTQLNTSPEWQSFDNSPNRNNEQVYVGGQWYPLSDWGVDGQGVITLSLTIPPGYTLPTYSASDSIQIRWSDPSSLLPAVWFDPSDSPYGMDNFRGAVIKYHAYTENNSGTYVGTIQYSYDGNNSNQEVTHSEHWSGDNDMALMCFWHFEGGRLYYKNTIPDTERVLIHWTATMFYGNESNC